MDPFGMRCGVSSGPVAGIEQKMLAVMDSARRQASSVEQAAEENQMILRIVHAATLPEKRQAYIDFVNFTIAPTLRKSPGCQFVYVAHCIEKGHENELIWVSGWDSLERTEALEKTDVYSGIAEKAKTFFTDRYSESGALHIHYKTFADFA